MASHAKSWKRRLPIVVLSLCLAGSLAELGAQSGSSSASLFYFPRFVASQGASSGIAIFNPSSQTASVTLTLADVNGSLVTGVVNPITVAVPARGQIAKTAGDI